jgi:hypothetical protein
MLTVHVLKPIYKFMKDIVCRSSLSDQNSELNYYYS